MNKFVKRIGICFIVGIAVAGSVWFGYPYILVAKLDVIPKKAEGNPARAEVGEGLVKCGDRAIPAIIWSLDRSGPWQRQSAFLSGILGEIGGPAREVLLKRISEAEECIEIAKWIYVLQEGFQDYSQFERVVECYESGQIRRVTLLHFDSAARLHNPEAPDMLDDSGKVAEAFLGWASARSN